MRPRGSLPTTDTLGLAGARGERGVSPQPSQGQGRPGAAGRRSQAPAAPRAPAPGEADRKLGRQAASQAWAPARRAAPPRGSRGEVGEAGRPPGSPSARASHGSAGLCPPAATKRPGRRGPGLKGVPRGWRSRGSRRPWGAPLWGPGRGRGSRTGPEATAPGPRAGLTSRRGGRASVCRNLDTLKRFMATGTAADASSRTPGVGSQVHAEQPRLPLPRPHPGPNAAVTPPARPTANRSRLRPPGPRPQAPLLSRAHHRSRLPANPGTAAPRGHALIPRGRTGAGGRSREAQLSAHVSCGACLRGVWAAAFAILCAGFAVESLRCT